MSKLVLKIRISVVIVSNFVCLSALCGDFQGGGGGTLNLSVKRFLDTRNFVIDGRNKFVMPRLEVLNTCRFGDTLHTIKKVSTCADYDTEIDSDTLFESSKRYVSKCRNFSKTHIQKEIPQDGIKVCAEPSTKVIAGIIKNVCLSFHDEKRKEVKLSYWLDVYRKDFTASRFSNYANPEKDHFFRKIKYQIPDCTEVDVED